MKRSIYIVYPRLKKPVLTIFLGLVLISQSILTPVAFAQEVPTSAQLNPTAVPTDTPIPTPPPSNTPVPVPTSNITSIPTITPPGGLPTDTQTPGLSLSTSDSQQSAQVRSNPIIRGLLKRHFKASEQIGIDIFQPDSNPIQIAVYDKEGQEVD